MRLGLFRITFPALVVALFGTAVATQETSDKPLSVIDWLGTQAPAARPRQTNRLLQKPRWPR